MAGLSPQRSPSVGSIIKKMLEINPELTMPELIAMIRESTTRRGGAGEFADVEVVDEARALELARQSLSGK